jgi:hypothetical protein
MQQSVNLIPLREFCRQKPWPRLPQMQHWINSKHPIATKCVKKIGNRYIVDVTAFENYVKNATLEEVVS